MIFNLSNKYGKENAAIEFKRLNEIAATIELKAVKMNRTSAQNRALHLFFTQVSEQLNNIGIPFVYRGLKGMEIETTWTPELFKEMTWKPIQKLMFGTDSTTKLKRNQIDPIFETINKFFAERGIEVTFPNEFDYYLKFYEKTH